MPKETAPSKSATVAKELVQDKRREVSQTQVAKSPAKVQESKQQTVQAKKSEPVSPKEPKQVIQESLTKESPVRESPAQESAQDNQAADPRVPTRFRRKRKSRAPWVLAGLAGVVVLQIIVLTFMDPSQTVVRRRRVEFVPPAVIPRVSNKAVPKSLVADAAASKQDPDSDRETNSYQVVQDQRLLYIPTLAIGGF